MCEKPDQFAPHRLWSGLILPGLIDVRDKVLAHGLSCRVKYVRLVRRKMGEQTPFSTQLTCEGVPYRKERHASRVSPITRRVDGPGRPPLGAVTPASERVVCGRSTHQRIRARLLERGPHARGESLAKTAVMQTRTSRLDSGEWFSGERDARYGAPYLPHPGYHAREKVFPGERGCARVLNLLREKND
jgi:hypothetical protein